MNDFRLIELLPLLDFFRFKLFLGHPFWYTVWFELERLGNICMCSVLHQLGVKQSKYLSILPFLSLDIILTTDNFFFQKDATNGYLKLLLVTAAEGDNAGGTSKRFDYLITYPASYICPV